MFQFAFSVFLSLLVSLALASGARAITFADGLTHTVNSAYVEVNVEDGPGSAPTTVNVEEGAIITHWLSSYGSSLVNMNGGAVFVGGFEVWQNSVLNFSGGAVGSNLTVSDEATVNMSGGEVALGLSLVGDSLLDMFGGAVFSGVGVGGNATASISGGEAQYLGTSEYSSATITGGALGSTLQTGGFSSATMSGGTLDGSFYARDSSTIVIVGSDFAVDGITVPYGDLTALTGTLTGTLAYGDLLDNTFHQGGYQSAHWEATGTITLASIPEPTTALLLATGLAGLAAAGRRRRPQER